MALWPPDLAVLATWQNALLFLAGAAAVWLSGAKLGGYVDLIADRTGMGRAFAGALLLGGVTSLPELATTLTASASGAAELAGNNLLGGIVAQMAVLAAMDLLAKRGAPLTFFARKPSLLLQGTFLIFVTAAAGAAIASGEIASVAGVGLWPVLLAGAYVGGLWLLHRYEGDPRWAPTGELREPPEATRDLKDLYRERYRGLSTRKVWYRFGLAAAGVLVSGFVVARSGEVLADHTGIGQGFVGATLVAVATSLPEVSTTWSAIRFGAYGMAAANILGTNSLEVALLLPADLAYRSGSIIDAMQPSAGYLAALGVTATAVYLWGILERRERTVLGMGVDSPWCCSSTSRGWRCSTSCSARSRAAERRGRPRWSSTANLPGCCWPWPSEPSGWPEPVRSCWSGMKPGCGFLSILRRWPRRLRVAVRSRSGRRQLRRAAGVACGLR